MLALVVGNNQAIATKIQSILIDHEIDCPPANVISIDLAQEVMTRDRFAPDLIFVVLSPDIEPALAVLQALRQRTRAKLVAVGSARDPRKILQVVHAGPDDYLDEDGDLENQIEATLSRLGTLAPSQAANGTLLTVMSPNGGAGCSMIATNLAFALAEIHGRCCLCDLDLRRGDLASMLNLKPRHTIIDLCSNVQKLDRPMFEQSLLQHDAGVHLLAAPQSFEDVQQVTSDAVEKVMQFARSSFPCVVVDLEDFFHREQFRVLQMSDVIFFVFRLDFSALRNARRTLDYLEKVRVDRDKLRLVVNQYGRPKELSAEQAESALRMKIAYYVPDDPKTVIPSCNRGVPVVLDSPRSKVSKAIKKAAASVVETMTI